jgi:hypothetical protein
MSELHWLAGFIDARGGIRVGATLRENIVRVESSSCERAILVRAQQIAGGTIQARPSDRRGGHADPDAIERYGYRNGGLRKRLYRWRMSAEAAVNLLTLVRPLLASRQRQRPAARAIKAFETRKSKSSTKETPITDNGERSRQGREIAVTISRLKRVAAFALPTAT